MTEDVGPTGTFPQGKISENDEGAINMAVGSDLSRNLVYIQFGSPIAWTAFPVDGARGLAALLLKHADRVEESEKRAVKR